MVNVRLVWLPASCAHQAVKARCAVEGHDAADALDRHDLLDCKHAATVKGLDHRVPLRQGGAACGWPVNGAAGGTAPLPAWHNSPGHQSRERSSSRFRPAARSATDAGNRSCCSTHQRQRAPLQQLVASPPEPLHHLHGMAAANPRSAICPLAPPPLSHARCLAHHQPAGQQRRCACAPLPPPRRRRPRSA